MREINRYVFASYPESRVICDSEGRKYENDFELRLNLLIDGLRHFILREEILVKFRIRGLINKKCIWCGR